jgi:8-oxo-dGTP diphosphatase
VLKRIGHSLLVLLVPVCFNVLNLLLARNLPPFGAACVIVEDNHGRFLVVRQSPRRVSLPGGYMRWRETPMQAACRECKEETGLDVELHEMIGTYSNPAHGLRQMSTLTVAYTGTVMAGDVLRGSIEGQPCWLTEAEMRPALRSAYRHILNDYLTQHLRKMDES